MFRVLVVADYSGYVLLSDLLQRHKETQVYRFIAVEENDPLDVGKVDPFVIALVREHPHKYLRPVANTNARS